MPAGTSSTQQQEPYLSIGRHLEANPRKVTLTGFVLTGDPLYNGWNLRNFLWMICSWVVSGLSQFVVLIETGYCLRVNY